MKGQKQSKADLHDKQIKALINVVNYLKEEVDHLTNLSVGTLETVKLMPGYGAAIMQLQEQAKEKEDSDVE
jgi:hypothetical protein